MANGGEFAIGRGTRRVQIGETGSCRWHDRVVRWHSELAGGARLNL